MRNKIIMLMLVLLAIPFCFALTNATTQIDNTTSTVTVVDRSILQTDNANLYALYAHGGSTPLVSLWLAESINEGMNWTKYNLSLANESSETVMPSMIYDRLRNVLHITFETTGTNGAARISYIQWNLTNKSTVNGKIDLFTPTTAGKNYSVSRRQNIALLNNGTLGIVYNRADGQATPKIDVKFRTCDSNCWNLSQWSAETIIADASAMNNSNQVDPQLQTNGSNFYVVWYGSDTGFANVQAQFKMMNAGGWQDREIINANATTTLSVNSAPSFVVYNDTPMVLIDTYISSRNNVSFTYRNDTNWTGWITVNRQISDSSSWVMSLGVLRNGSLIASYNNYTALTTSWYNVSDDGGLTWSAGVSIANNFGSGSYSPYIPEISYQYNNTNKDLLMMTVDNLNKIYSKLLENNYPFVNYTVTQNSQVLGTTNTSYYLNLSYELTNGTNITDITNVYFYWNGTQYATSEDDYNDTRNNFSTSVILPFTGTTIIPTYWTYEVDLTDGTNWTATTATVNQTILSVNLSNTTGTQTLNFTFFDENTNVSITNDMSVAFQVWYTNFSRALNFSYYQSGKTNYSFYLNPSGYDYHVNAIISYNKTNYTTRFYYLDDATINGNVQNISLWNIQSNNASNIYLTLYDNNDNQLSGYYVKALKYFVAANTYETVEMTSTDSNGNGMFHLVPYDVLYKFIVQKDGVTYLETTPAKIISTSLILRLPSTENWFDQFNRYLAIQYSAITYDNSTQTFSWTYNDVNNLVASGCLKVIKRSTTADSVQCESCSASTAATLNCVVDGTMAGYYQAQGYINTNTNYSSYSLVVKDLDLSNSWHYYGLLGVLLSWFVICTLALAGGVSPVGVIVMCLLGLVVVALFGLTFIGQSILILMVILGGFLIFKMRN